MLLVANTGECIIAVGLIKDDEDVDEVVVCGAVKTTSLLTVSSIVDVMALLLWKKVIKLVYVVK